ncbi:hypothetical protein EYF80_060040 [Liparis tanakae]|uniref:Uncharacterized protein n=1 Tax=Liparis tanakae TaxID=230148 RepID=A0A4Z2EMM2_9TELE|nr:hypothetical protein EYF80_060040 [Liparis tanakae]
MFLTFRWRLFLLGLRGPPGSRSTPGSHTYIPPLPLPLLPLPPLPSTCQRSKEAVGYDFTALPEGCLPEPVMSPCGEMIGR